MTKVQDYTPIETVVQVGKSKTEVPLMFLAKDFDRIENGCLYLRNNETKYKVSPQQIFNIYNQLNQD